MTGDVLREFIERSSNDQRISTTHIAVYLALYALWMRTGVGGQLLVFQRDVLPLAKISSSATYVKILRDLNEYGYLHYKPSHNKAVGSVIELRNKDW